MMCLSYYFIKVIMVDSLNELIINILDSDTNPKSSAEIYNHIGINELYNDIGKHTLSLRFVMMACDELYQNGKIKRIENKENPKIVYQTTKTKLPIFSLPPPVLSEKPKQEVEIKIITQNTTITLNLSINVETKQIESNK